MKKFLRKFLVVAGSAVSMASEVGGFLPGPVNIAIGVLSGVLAKIPDVAWKWFEK